MHGIVKECWDLNHPPLPMSHEPARTESLITYPSLFPIKVMGIQQDGLVEAIAAIAQEFDPDFDAARTELRASRTGKYLGVTITVMATSRAQLDALYLALTQHPLVKVVL